VVTIKIKLKVFLKNIKELTSVIWLFGSKPARARSERGDLGGCPSGTK
jgi:hypothetical protein